MLSFFAPREGPKYALEFEEQREVYSEQLQQAFTFTKAENDAVSNLLLCGINTEDHKEDFDEINDKLLNYDNLR